MNISEEQYELAERYLAGLLTGKELFEFERLMDENPSLKEQTEKIRSINELIFREGLKTEIPHIQKAQEQYLFRQQLKHYGKWLGGSFIILVAAITWWSYAEKEEPSLRTVQVSEIKTTEKSKTQNNIPDQPKLPGSTSSAHLSVGTTKDVEKKIDPIILEQKINPTEPGITQLSEKKDTVKTISALALKEDPCRETVLGSFEVNGSCENMNEGSIRLVTVTGGTKPYLLSLDQGKYRETTVLQLLSGGEYQVTIKDGRGCTSKLYTIEVPVKLCSVPGKDFVFSYQTTQEFEFPELGEKQFTFKVFNRAGGTEYSIEVNQGNPSSWNGYNASGQKLPIGSYSYQIVSLAHKLLQQGTITIVD